jgi:hypothetical protein
MEREWTYCYWPLAVHIEQNILKYIVMQFDSLHDADVEDYEEIY